MLTSILESHISNASAIRLTTGETFSYLQLNNMVAQMAAKLAGVGLKPGMTVNIVINNGIEFIASFLSVIRCGAIAAPLNPSYTANEFSFYIADAGSTFIIVKDLKNPSVNVAKTADLHVLSVGVSKGTIRLEDLSGELTSNRDPEVPNNEAVALFLHTSGTTSKPKGVPLTHDNLLTSVANIVETYNLTELDSSTVVMPLFHVHGLIGVALSTLASGGCLVIPPRFSAGTFWKTQADTNATWYSAVPTIHKILLDRAGSDHAPDESFRFIRSCSAALSKEILLGIEDRFGSPVVEAYGMTEASHQMSSNRLPPFNRHPGTVGHATGVEISVRGENGFETNKSELGEVCVKGSSVMGGYVNNEFANNSAFWGKWFRTGDQGFLSDDNYLTLTGRLKELINRGGEKISPLEVDHVILSHPAVSEAICFSMPDAKYGECVNAAVVSSESISELSIKNYCAEKLASFKIPDRIYFLDELPKSATGKVQRRHIAEMFKEIK